MKIRRYNLSNLFLLVLGCHFLYMADYWDNFVVSIFFIVGALAMFCELANKLINTNFLKKSGENITLHLSFFRKKHFTADDVDYVFMRYDLFGRSYFQFNSGKRIIFDAWMLEKEDLDILKSLIPVKEKSR